MTQELPLSDVGTKGNEWFGRLEPVLLSEHSPRDFVAIDVLTGEFAVARSTGDALRSLRRRLPGTQLFLRRIGDEPEPELAARLFAAGVAGDVVRAHSGRSGETVTIEFLVDAGSNGDFKQSTLNLET